MRGLLLRSPPRAALAAAVMLALPAASALASVSDFTGTLDSLNNSGVSGTVHLHLDGTTLQVNIDATGLQADEPHPQHIHGLLDGGFAQCPTMAQDTNGDGFVSVLEGAVPYGPIKVNLTDPPTAFGPPANTTLFAPFAGVANTADFPTAPGGVEHFSSTIHFDLSKSADAAAFAAINPLTKQHVVIHGMNAPETVDGFGTDPSHIIYDPLLPVACSELTKVSAIPLPAGVWTGLGMLGVLGLAGAARVRRRAC